MFKINTVRHDYCTARVDIEEAKILDKKGDHYASSKKYAQAAKTLEKIAETLETDEEGATEFQFILSLSRAWQKMMLAEAEASPELYVEASKLFEQAREFGPNEKAKMLVMGHSRFCRALEAGTRFADTRNLAMHESAIQHLESAANYYEKAGFQNASEYANATGSLFDAYVYMDNAKKEPDPEKKAKFYMMAEKVLQAAAGNYLRAEHPEKMEQVQKLLERVKKEQELAMSLTEVLHTPIVVSTTTFPAPASTSEKAVGLERFEYANVQANIITRQTELKIGEDFDMEIELVNAGRHPTLLIKIAEAFPKTFQLVEKPENLRVEGTNIILKGKRLDPLKTEDVKLTLKPEAQGEFQLTPRILYLDENGKTKTCLSEPVTVSVRELGISGWLKGPGKPK
jgi:tetratricopeptide (TPR) repeat protein